MEYPRIVVTGASGFVGRHLLDALKEKYKIFGIARRSQHQCGAPVHPNITWRRVDIGDTESLASVFSEIAQGGQLEAFIHLAAYYDFTGLEHAEYWRTNVTGLRNILELCTNLELKKFIFASSTAASSFPETGDSLDETSQADGEHIYARTKKAGEEMLREYAGTVPSCIVRFAAMYSDWCEYPPLYMFLGNWLSKTLTSRILAGKGNSAIPYLHVRDAISLLVKSLKRIDNIDQNEVLLASPDGAITHHQLFDYATSSYFGERKRPILMPKVLCRTGIYLRRFFGYISGYRPFEYPWMCRYIDRQMNMDANRTREKLNWNPKPRLDILRRIPFMVENYKAEPAEWHRRNMAALKPTPIALHLKINGLLKAHEQEIIEGFYNHVMSQEGKKRFGRYQQLMPNEKSWFSKQLMAELMNSVRTKDKSLFKDYCHNIALRRHEEGFSVQEVCDALAVMNKTVFDILRKDPGAGKLPASALKDFVSVTIQFGIDEIQEVFEEYGDADYDPDSLIIDGLEQFYRALGDRRFY